MKTLAELNAPSPWRRRIETEFSKTLDKGGALYARAADGRLFKTTKGKRVALSLDEERLLTSRRKAV